LFRKPFYKITSRPNPSAFVRKGRLITVDWLGRCLDKNKQTGHLKELAHDYGIERLLICGSFDRRPRPCKMFIQA